MAKDKERKIARNYYVDMGKTAKEISELIGVSEQTLNKWVNDPNENWKEQRNAQISNSEIQTQNITQLINALCEDRLRLNARLKDVEAKLEKAKEKSAKDALSAEALTIRDNMASLDDSVSKWNKTRAQAQKEGEISFDVYVKVCDMVFQDMHGYDEKLYLKTIDFQEQHINKVASRYN